MDAGMQIIMCTSTVLYVGSIACTLKGADIANGACNDTTWTIDLKLLIYNNITIQERVDKKITTCTAYYYWVHLSELRT